MAEDLNFSKTRAPYDSSSLSGQQRTEVGREIVTYFRNESKKSAVPKSRKEPELKDGDWVRFTDGNPMVGIGARSQPFQVGEVKKMYGTLNSVTLLDPDTGRPLKKRFMSWVFTPITLKSGTAQGFLAWRERTERES
jgi:hypothetical protein